jgi:hypothetical protein
MYKIVTDCLAFGITNYIYFNIFQHPHTLPTRQINRLKSLITIMHFSTTFLALITATSISTAAPIEARQDNITLCPVVQEGDYVWKISNFYSRKLNGTSINSIDFNISATNNGTLNFQCAASADEIEGTKFYKCGENSFISFAFQSERDGLLLKQDVSDE